MKFIRVQGSGFRVQGSGFRVVVSQAEASPKVTPRRADPPVAESVKKHMQEGRLRPMICKLVRLSVAEKIKYFRQRRICLWHEKLGLTPIFSVP